MFFLKSNKDPTEFYDHQFPAESALVIEHNGSYEMQSFPDDLFHLLGYAKPPVNENNIT